MYSMTYEKANMGEEKAYYGGVPDIMLERGDAQKSDIPHCLSRKQEEYPT